MGMPSASSSKGELQFDQRLFNQNKGMDSGFGDDEAYNVYDKPWRQDRDIGTSIYRPSKNVDKDVYGDDLDKLIKGSNRSAFLISRQLNTEQTLYRIYNFDVISLFISGLSQTRALQVQTAQHVVMVQYSFRGMRRMILSISTSF